MTSDRTYTHPGVLRLGVDSRRQGPPAQPKEVPLTDVHPLPALSLSALRDEVLAGDPGCVCDPELFDGPAGINPGDEPPDERAARIAVAREVCATCPVRLPCEAYALRTRPDDGVWAGHTAEEITWLATAANWPARPRSAAALRPVIRERVA